MGFDVERFLEPVDDDLKCGICFGVLEDPLATPCGHVFCAQCIVQWTAESGSCPLTCEQISVDDLKKIQPLSSLIAKQNIRCENFRRGCPAILLVENTQSHLLKCRYAKDSTSGAKIMERNSNSPESREFARVVVCESGCGLPLMFQGSHDCIKALQTQVASLQMKLTRAEQEKELACERIARREEANQDRILNLENELHSYQVQVLNFERQLKEYRLQVGIFQKYNDPRADQVGDISQIGSVFGLYFPIERTLYALICLIWGTNRRMACMYERVVILPNQYPDRFDQLASTVGVTENGWMHSGAPKPSSVKIHNRCYVFLESGTRARS